MGLANEKFDFSQAKAGWFGSMDRYTGGKGGDRALWLEAYGGRPYTLDRVKNGGEPFHIPSLAISVIGGIQPDRLESCLLKGDDDGLSSRFLYICPQPALRQRPRQVADRWVLDRLVSRLDALTHDVNDGGEPIPRNIPLSAEAADRFELWWRALTDLKNSSGSRMNGWWGKAQGIGLRIALVLEYLAWAVSPDDLEPREVSAGTIDKAMHFIDAYAGPMAERAHGVTGRGDVDANTLKLARYIRDQRPSELSVRELQRCGPMRNLKAGEIKEACFNLVGLGWLQAAPIRHSDTPGKSQGRFLVNPAL